MKCGVIVLLFLLLACMVPREARQLKRATREWRQSEEVFRGYIDGVFGSTTLTLRKNGRFERNSSGLFMKWFEAGKWTIRRDTIYLVVVDQHLTPVRTEKVYRNGVTHSLIVVGPTISPGLMRVLVDNIKE